MINFKNLKNFCNFYKFIENKPKVFILNVNKQFTFPEKYFK